MSPEIEIVHPPPARWGMVLNLAFANRPVSERMRLVEAIFHGVAPAARAAQLRGLFEARQGEETVGAALAVVQPGQTAAIYQPQLRTRAPDLARDALWQALDLFLAQEQVRLAQEVLPVELSHDAERTKARGYAIDVQMVYLASMADRFPEEQPQGDLAFSRFDPEESERLQQLLERTYADTLDCPELNGVRAMDDVVTGYLHSGETSARWWHIARESGRDVGCVLVTRHAGGAGELIYMGLIPEARGRGWGGLMARFAQWQARCAECTALSVAVDHRNHPAYRVYERAGFKPFDRRRVLLKVL